MQRAKYVHRNRSHPSNVSAVSPPDLYCNAAVQSPNAVVPQPGTGPVAVPNSQWPAVTHVIHTIPPEFMPNNYLSVTLAVVIICSILDITSMMISLLHLGINAVDEIIVYQIY